MHIFFSGIGGTAIGPLALIAKQAGYDVSGSDQQDSQYIDYLKEKGLNDIHIGQKRDQISSLHAKKPIDWLVRSSAVGSNSPELQFAHEQNIKVSKRDELINQIVKDKKLKMIAVAGTHGKTTTTAMVVWLFKQLGLPLSYSVGAKIPFGAMGQYHKGSEYFVYEADEFDRNFLAFEPFLSVITGVSWDHHEIFPTREDYQQAFREFIGQSSNTLIWKEDADYLKLGSADKFTALDSSDQHISDIKLAGQFNRLDGWLAVEALRQSTDSHLMDLLLAINKFPGLARRMEEIVPGLYSDYAHTPEKIRGAMSVATEMAQMKDQKVAVIYEPLTNRRQHYMIDDYKNCFNGASKVYWLPSYLAREDPAQRVIPPKELISHLSNPELAEPAVCDDNLKRIIQKHLDNGDIVVAMAGGGGNSLDEWIRKEFKP